MSNGIHIEQREGVFHLSGVLDEYADLSPLLGEKEPLRLNLLGITRLNSIGVRNLLKFLASWGNKPFIYEHCSSEFIDQVCMIPSLLGQKKQGTVASFYVPYECTKCDAEHEIYGEPSQYVPSLKGGNWPEQPCPVCGSPMQVVTDTFFSFLASP